MRNTDKHRRRFLILGCCLPMIFGTEGSLTFGGVDPPEAIAAASDQTNVMLYAKVELRKPSLSSAAVRLYLINVGTDSLSIKWKTRPMSSTIDSRRLVLARNGRIVSSLSIGQLLISPPVEENCSLPRGESLLDCFDICHLAPGHYDLVGMFSYGIVEGTKVRMIALPMPHLTFDIPQPTTEPTTKPSKKQQRPSPESWDN